MTIIIFDVGERLPEGFAVKEIINSQSLTLHD
jgi:hypothetical protein